MFLKARALVQENATQASCLPLLTQEKALLTYLRRIYFPFLRTEPRLAVLKNGACQLVSAHSTGAC